MDARGGSGEGDDRVLPDQDGPRLGRGRGAGRLGADGDPLMMAVPKGGGASDLIGAETLGGTVEDLGPSDAYSTWTDAAPASNGPIVCKFLRSIGPDGKLFEPRGDAVPTHRCAAFGDPLPLSLRQQELVCLQRVHVSCPRYMRGTLLAEESATAAVVKAPRSGVPYLTIAGLALVACAGIAAIAGMMGLLPGSGGGPSPSDGHSPIAAATASPSPAATPTVNITLVPTPSQTPAASPSATIAPAPTPTPAAPTFTPAASATWPPGATALTMDLVVLCSDQPNCYIYTVRGPGPGGNGSKVADTVAGIAHFFRVDINKIYAMNPWARSGVRAGDKLKIPPPTR